MSIGGWKLSESKSSRLFLVLLLSATFFFTLSAYELYATIQGAVDVGIIRYHRSLETIAM